MGFVKISLEKLNEISKEVGSKLYQDDNEFCLHSIRDTKYQDLNSFGVITCWHPIVFGIATSADENSEHSVKEIENYCLALKDFIHKIECINDKKFVLVDNPFSKEEAEIFEDIDWYNVRISEGKGTIAITVQQECQVKTLEIDADMFDCCDGEGANQFKNYTISPDATITINSKTGIVPSGLIHLMGSVDAKFIFGEGITRIGSKALNGSPKEIVLPSTLNEIYTRAFVAPWEKEPKFSGKSLNSIKKAPYWKFFEKEQGEKEVTRLNAF